MRIKDYIIDKCFLSLTVSQVFGSWVPRPHFRLCLKKRVDKKAMVNSKIEDVTDWTTNN